MKPGKCAIGFVSMAICAGCAAPTLKDPEITKRDNIGNYSFVVLPKTESISSSSGGVYGSEYGVYVDTSSKEINPGQIIEGVLLKRDLISTETVRSGDEGKTLIVKYGESRRRDIAGGLGGYTLEVAIAMVTSKTNEIIYSCAAEGQGETEADDVREAIYRCLSDI